MHAAPGTTDTDETEQRDYVGTLRGALDLEDGIAPVAAAPQPTVTPKSAALLAGMIAALVSTANRLRADVGRGPRERCPPR